MKGGKKVCKGAEREGREGVMGVWGKRMVERGWGRGS